MMFNDYTRKPYVLNKITKFLKLKDAKRPHKLIILQGHGEIESGHFQIYDGEYENSRLLAKDIKKCFEEAKKKK